MFVENPSAFNYKERLLILLQSIARVVNGGIDVTNINSSFYSTGTFSPSIVINGSGVGITYSAIVGRYTKIGNSVRFTIFIALTNKGASVGNVDIIGLPFTSTSAGSAYHIIVGRLNNAGGLAGGQYGVINPGATTLNLQFTGVGAVGVVQDANLTNTTDFLFSGVYEANS